MTKHLNYLGIDQYGQHYHIATHPRRELCEQLGTKHADRMYVDLPTGGTRHVGYVIAGRWVHILRVSSWR